MSLILGLRADLVLGLVVLDSNLGSGYIFSLRDIEQCRAVLIRRIFESLSTGFRS